MAEYCDDPANIEFQKRMPSAGLVAATPSVANGGRVLNIMDRDAFGWTRIREMFAEDQLIALVSQDHQTFVPKLKAARGDGYDLPVWQESRGTAKEVSTACAALLTNEIFPRGLALKRFSTLTLIKLPKCKS